MKKIAITGGLSSGKTTVCQFLAELSAYIVSADEIVHNLLSSDSNVQKQIVDLLGTDVLIQGQLNREAIAKKVFSREAQLKSLENILHPLVFHTIESRYQAVKNDSEYTFFVAEVPLLYETKNVEWFDAVVVVLAEEKLCEKRFCERKEGTAAPFAERILRQIPPSQKAARADFVLQNNGDKVLLKNQVIKLATQLHLT